MPKPYSLDLRERVFGYADEGHSCRAAARRFRGVGFLCRQPGEGLSCAGSLAPKPSGGRRIARTASGVSFCRRSPRKADVTMPELAAELAAWPTKVDPASLSRWLIRIGYRFKKNSAGQRA